MKKPEFKDDFYRKYGRAPRAYDLFKIIKYQDLLYIYLLRIIAIESLLSKLFFFPLNYIHYRLRKKYGIEIQAKTNIGSGLLLVHPYNITINPRTIIGCNVTIYKGVTIGQENRGKRKGSPTIGDEVFIGSNSTIVGSIIIGNNVLIAPNSYVNINIPDNSLVIGNPCIIIFKENATCDYLKYKV